MEKKTTSRRTSVFLGERNTSLFSRVVAKLIDMLIVIAVYFLGDAVQPWLGVVASTLLCASFDSLWAGQSIGKKIMGLRVIEDNMGLPCPFSGSVLRNLPFVLLIGLATAPMLWFVCGLVALPLCVFEVYLIFSLDTGVRFGDVLGNTLVVEYLDDGIAA